MTWHVKTSMKRTTSSAGSAQPAAAGIKAGMLYFSAYCSVPLSALRRMALQNVKHVAWLAYQLELKETQKHRDNGVNHVSVVGRLQTVGHVSTLLPALVTTGHTVSPIPSPVPWRPFLGRTY